MLLVLAINGVGVKFTYCSHHIDFGDPLSHVVQLSPLAGGYYVDTIGINLTEFTQCLEDRVSSLLACLCTLFSGVTIDKSAMLQMKIWQLMSIGCWKAQRNSV